MMGNYPVDAGECFEVAMWGGCGTRCPVYLDARCEVHKEIKSELNTEEEREEYNEIYGNEGEE